MLRIRRCRRAKVKMTNQNPKLIQKRLKKAYFVGKIISIFPYVRCVILNGSLTGNKHKASSDIDILVIAKNKHIFTARFFINFWTTIFGIKRSKNPEKLHAGKFCFNYFLTESFLRIPTGRGEKIDRYCADNYSKSKYIAGDIKLYKRFMAANKALFQKYNFEIRNPNIEIRNKFQNPNFKIKKIWEMIFGSWFEKWAKKYQIKNIESNPRTKKYPDLIVFSNKELRFHPPKRQGKHSKY